MGASIVTAVIDRDKNFIIQGRYEYQRHATLQEGILVPPNGANLPTASLDANEIFFLTAVEGLNQPGLYRYDGAAWVSIAQEGSPQNSVAGVLLVSGSTVSVHLTIGAALAAASSGDVVQVGPGTWTESLTVPDGVSLVATFPKESAVISGALATGVRVTLGNGCVLHGFQVNIPTDALGAIVFSGTGGANLSEVRTVGFGGSGIGIVMNGAGRIQIDDCSHVSGDAAKWFNQTAGTVNIKNAHVRAGTFTSLCSFAGAEVEIVHFTGHAAASAVNGLELGSTENILRGLDLDSSLTKAIRITADGIMVEARDFDLDGTVLDIEVASGLTGTGTVVNLQSATFAANKFLAPATWLSTASVLVAYRETGFDEAFKFLGELNVGFAEKGFESAFGEGDSYVRGMVVLTTDSTAGATSDGGNITNVSAAAASPSGSTFTFQGVGVNYTILCGSVLENTDKIKHWGLKVGQTIAAVEIAPRSFVIEVWDGAAWVSVGVMATESNRFYRYANELFIRAGSSEHLRFGLGNNSSWVKKTISGQNLFWSRIRIVTAVTTAPTFESFKLHSSRSEKNSDGTDTYHGTSRFKQTLLSSGNVFGESGGVNAFNLPIGSGGVPTGWNHNVKNSHLNGGGDAVYLQFTLPRGIDTSHPMEVTLGYVPTTPSSNDVQLICSFLPTERQGVLEADSGGSVTPVSRTLANTETVTSKVAQTDARTVDAGLLNKIYSQGFGPYDISNYYEGDVVFLRLELDNDGAGNANLLALLVEVSGVKWTHGERL